jgi:hypothetical protein
MKINELLEGVVTSKDDSNMLRAEFQELLDYAGVTAFGTYFSYRLAKKPNSIAIGSIVIPKIENGEYDADEANLSLRLAHRLISKWLAQKEANGQSVTVDRDSDVGGGRKFSTHPQRIWVGSEHIEGSCVIVSVTIANKADTAPAS